MIAPAYTFIERDFQQFIKVFNWRVEQGYLYHEQYSDALADWGLLTDAYKNALSALASSSFKLEKRESRSLLFPAMFWKGTQLMKPFKMD